ncbi:hypothetical protein D9M70_257930 [compost metagenome]
MKKLCVLMTVLGVVAQSHAQAPTSKIFAPGVETCATFLARTQGNTSAQAELGSYIEGFATGVNYGVSGRFDFFESTTASSRLQFVQNYCRSNPQQQVFNALEALLKLVGMPERR